jgi:hypothetical protein
MRIKTAWPYAVLPERKNSVPTSMSSNKLMPKTRASSQKASTESIPTPSDNRSKHVLPSLLGSPSEQGQPSFLDGIPPRGDFPKSTLPNKVAEGPIVLWSLPSGKRTMSFEGFMSNEYCLYLADAGAAHTFVSRQYCSFHNMQFVSMSAK